MALYEEDKSMFTNRAPWDMQRHDTMFNLNVKDADGNIDTDHQLANDTSAYNVTYDNFRYAVSLLKDGDKIADVEDVRVVWKRLDKAQAKFRVAKLADNIAVSDFSKTDDISLLIQTKSVAHNDSLESREAAQKYPDRKLSQEPPKTLTIERYMNEPKESNTITIAPNKWLYVGGVFGDVIV